MIEFIEELHIYLYNGVILPSVSKLLRKLFPNKYDNIPKFILERKAKYGTEVHSIIEKIENNEDYYTEDENIKNSISDYLIMKNKYNIEVISQEQMVHYKHYYAGRYDMIANINGKKCLCDIKTTQKLDNEYLSWQLSLYELAIGERFYKLYAIWLPKGKEGSLVEIKRKKKKEILEFLRSE